MITNNLIKLPKLTPLVIGGMGGSGTRLIAECVEKLGFFLGDDLNVASDNLLFTLFFVRTESLTVSNNDFNKLLDIFTKSMFNGPDTISNETKDIVRLLAHRERPPHTVEWLNKRADNFLSNTLKPKLDQPWGWKEPNSHILLSRLEQYYPSLKYIHVVRNGLDMAYSSNQNQLKLWGRFILGENVEPSPYNSLKYWCAIHKRLQLQSEAMMNDIYFLNYDKFCSSPESEISKLLKFLELDVSQDKSEEIHKLITKPSSIGRFRDYGTKMFDLNDLAYVRQLGFETE